MSAITSSITSSLPARTFFHHVVRICSGQHHLETRRTADSAAASWVSTSPQ